MDNLRELTTEEMQRLLVKETRQSICEQYQISRRTLNRILKERGLTGCGLDRLSNETVAAIRLEHRTKEFTQMELADKYGVSQSLISKIVNEAIHRNNSNFVIGGEADVKIGYKHANH